MESSLETTSSGMSTTACDPAEELIYHITHDFRTPLRALKELPDWISEDSADAGIRLPDSVEGHLAALRKEAARLDNMLLDLRDYSRAVRCAEPDRPVSLAAIIQRLAPSLHGFDLITDLQVDALVAPPNDLAAMVEALISNAVKHHVQPPGKIGVSSRLDGDKMLIEIADDGPGIQPENHAAIFKMMTTLKRRDEVEGSGLGLPKARKIAESLGGGLRIVDRGGARGAVFEIELPAARASTSLSGIGGNGPTTSESE